MSDTETRAKAILRLVEAELSLAVYKFGPMKSGHEGYAVILEELDELWELVKRNESDTDAAFEEAIQVAAMACRYVLDLGESVTDEGAGLGTVGGLA